MFTKMKHRNFFGLLVAIFLGALLFSACSPAGEITETPASTSTAAPVLDGALQISMDTGSIASGVQIEMVPAAPEDENYPYWEVLPEYTRVTLEGYLISSHLMKPQIFIYPIDELQDVNEIAGKVALSLETLLQSPQKVQNMPYLPLYNAAQMMHTHIQYLDFKNGHGVRYLTEFSQGIIPINNFELVYTYQGLTNDGKYYVAAVLPVNHPSLPADGTVTGSEPPEFSEDYPVYLMNVAETLNTQAADTFTPNLTQLDAMLSSVKIQ